MMMIWSCAHVIQMDNTRKIDLFPSLMHHRHDRHRAVKRVKMNFSNLKLNRYERTGKKSELSETNDNSQIGMACGKNGKREMATYAERGRGMNGERERKIITVRSQNSDSFVARALTKMNFILTTTKAVEIVPAATTTTTSCSRKTE